MSMVDIILDRCGNEVTDKKEMDDSDIGIRFKNNEYYY